VRLGLLIVAAAAPSQGLYEREPLRQILMAFSRVRRALCASPFRAAGEA
jgi:hypothetical protein